MSFVFSHYAFVSGSPAIDNGAEAAGSRPLPRTNKAD
jgi:hypothetical protein